VKIERVKTSEVFDKRELTYNNECLLREAVFCLIAGKR
jgi:hypothetical protein